MKLFKKRETIIACGSIVGVILALTLKPRVREIHVKNVKAQLAQVCGNDSRCQGNINNYFEACFDKNYDYGSKWSRAGLNTEEFAKCMDNNAGKLYFVGRLVD